MDEDMVEIPSGVFRMGTSMKAVSRFAARYGYHESWLAGELPEREVDLPAFYIDRYPVTNAAFVQFCQATGHRVPPNWTNGIPARAQLNHPVTFVDRSDAKAFAEWRGARLPTEAEWEKAARGADGNAWPWGNSFDAARCQCNADGKAGGVGTAAVDAHPRGMSPYGVADMVGNAAEWCSDGPDSPSAFIKGGCPSVIGLALLLA